MPKSTDKESAYSNDFYFGQKFCHVNLLVLKAGDHPHREIGVKDCLHFSYHNGQMLFFFCLYHAKLKI